MANEWFYSHEGVKSGPYSAEQMKALAAAGDILPSDTVWKNDMTTGVLARKVAQLFVIETPVAPPILETMPVVPESPILPAPDEESTAELPPAIAPPQPKPEVAATPTSVQPPKTQPAPPPRKRMATAVTGATILSQDGVNVRFRKKCMVCGKEDTSNGTMVITLGTMKAGFFCSKCRKRREVTFRGAQA